MTKISKSGYKRNSKDKKEKSLIIPSSNITMKNVDFPVFGVDNLGNTQMMYPGIDYTFPGEYVYEVPMARYGGDPSIPDLSEGWLSKYQTAGQVGGPNIIQSGNGFEYGYSGDNVMMRPIGQKEWTTIPADKVAAVKNLMPGLDFDVNKLTPDFQAWKKQAYAELEQKNQEEIKAKRAETIQRNKFKTNPGSEKVLPPPVPITNRYEGMVSSEEQLPAPVSITNRYPGMVTPEEVLPSPVPITNRYPGMVTPPSSGPLKEKPYLGPDPIKAPSGFTFEDPAKKKLVKGNTKDRVITYNQEYKDFVYSKGDGTYDPSNQIPFLGPESSDDEDSIFKKISDYAQYWYEKEFGVSDAAESQLENFEEQPVNVNNESNLVNTPTSSPYKWKSGKAQILAKDSDVDYGNPNTKFWGFKRTAFNDEGMVYIPTPRKANWDGKGVNKAAGMAHFLIKSDLTDGYKDPETTNSIKKSIANNQYLPIYKKDQDGKVRLKYVKGSESLEEGWDYVAALRQEPLSNIDWSSSARPYHDGPSAKKDNYKRTGKGMFGKGISNVLTKDGKDTWMVYKDANGKGGKLGRFNGNSLVFIIEKNGERIIRDFTGTVEAIEKESKNLLDEFGVTENDVTLAFYDQGSYSAKPKADKNGFIPYKTYSTFNPDETSGAGLAIPFEDLESMDNFKMGGWLHKYQTTGEVNSELSKYMKQPMDPNDLRYVGSQQAVQDNTRVVVPKIQTAKKDAPAAVAEIQRVNAEMKKRGVKTPEEVYAEEVYAQEKKEAEMAAAANRPQGTRQVGPRIENLPPIKGFDNIEEYLLTPTFITEAQRRKVEETKQGNIDQWGRPYDNEWYGFDPSIKQFTVEDPWGRAPQDDWYGFDPYMQAWEKGTKSGRETPPYGYVAKEVSGAHGSTMTIWVDPKTGDKWVSSRTAAQQQASRDIAASNNIDPIGLGILMASGAGPAVRTAAAAMPWLNAPAVLPYIGEVPWLTATNVLGAYGAAHSTQQILDPSSELRTNPNAENMLMTGLGYLGLGIGKTAMEGSKQLGKSMFNTPKLLPGSGNVDELVDLWRIQERGARPMSELAAEGKLGPMFQNEKAIQHFKDREKYFGQWFTKDKADFDFYKADREFVDPEIIQLQVPKSKLAEFQKYDKTLSRAADREFVIPLDQQKLFTPTQLPGSSNVDDIVRLESEIATLKNQEIANDNIRKNLWADYKAGKITGEDYKFKVDKLFESQGGWDNPRFNLEKQLRELKVKNDIANTPQQNILQSESQLGKNISTGGSQSKGVFELGDDYVARLSAYGYDDASRLVNYQDKITSPRVAKTLQVKEIDGKVYQVQQKATGKPLDQLSQEELSNIPKEHINNFWKDKAELDNLGLNIDVSGGKSNIFYDTKKGFQLIDLGIGPSTVADDIIIRNPILKPKGLDLSRTSSKPKSTMFNKTEDLSDETFKIEKRFKGRSEEAKTIPRSIDITGKSGNWQFNRNDDGTFSFSANMTNPVESGRAMLKMDKLMPPKPTILEQKSYSLDSWLNHAKLKDRPHWSGEFDGYIPLNHSAVHNKSLAKFVPEATTEFSVFKNQADAEEALQIVNNLIKKQGITQEAKILKTGDSYEIQIPNFKLTRDYKHGGIITPLEAIGTGAAAVIAGQDTPQQKYGGWLQKYQTAGPVKPTSNFTLPSLDPQAQQAADYNKGWEAYNAGVRTWTELLQEKEEKKGRPLTTEEKQAWLQKAVKRNDGRKTVVDPNDPKWNFLFKDSYQTWDPEFGPMTVMNKPIEVTAERTEFDKEKARIAAETRQAEISNPFNKSLGDTAEFSPARMKRASQNANDQVALRILNDKPQGDRNRVEWLNTLTPEERSTIERSQYAGKLNPDYSSQFSQGFEKLLRRYTIPGQLFSNGPLWINPDYTPEEAANASAMGVLAPLSYPTNLVTGALTGDFGSALQGQTSMPLFTDYRQPEFAATMSGLYEAIYDPAEFLGGVGLLKGAANTAGKASRYIGSRLPTKIDLTRFTGRSGPSVLATGAGNLTGETAADRLDELRTIYHNAERILTLDEAEILNRKGYGRQSDYPGRIDLYNMGSEELQNMFRTMASNQQASLPYFSRNYDSNLLREDYVRLLNRQQPLNYSDITNAGENARIQTILNSANRAQPSITNTVSSTVPRANAIPINRSGLTKEQVLEKASTKGKDAISKLSETEFQNTVLKPNGEISLYYNDSLEPHFSGAQNVMAMSPKEYADAFNERLDLLNDMIAQRNKSGVEYRVKGLTPDGRLTFYTPPGQYTASTAKRSVVDVLNSDVRDLFRNRLHVPEGESTWTTNIKPGQWRGNVEDIANTQYFKGIPGLEMSNTLNSVFSDNLARKGSGAYESINEYLKALDLGRVKPGFNSQTQSSRAAWENFINSDRAVGFYSNPKTVYGIMKKDGGSSKYQAGGDYNQIPQTWKDTYDWTPNVEAEYQAFKNDPMGPSNLAGTDDMNDYNTRGMWDSLDRPADWKQGLDLYKQQWGEEWTPEEDGYYHAWSQHPGTGEWLKPKHHDTAWMNYGSYIYDPNNMAVVNPEGFFGNETLQSYPKEVKYPDGGGVFNNSINKKHNLKTSAEGYYAYINGVTLSKGGSPKSWLDKYK